MRVLLGVTGGIAAYKACELTRLLVKAGHEVIPLVTPGAQRFEKDRYAILVIGVEKALQQRYPNMSADAFKTTLSSRLNAHPSFAETVEILGFDAPSEADCAEQKRKDDERRAQRTSTDASGESAA